MNTHDLSFGGQVENNLLLMRWVRLPAACPLRPYFGSTRTVNMNGSIVVRPQGALMGAASVVCESLGPLHDPSDHKLPSLQVRRHLLGARPASADSPH
jgi:hypothetical protein